MTYIEREALFEQALKEKRFVFVKDDSLREELVIKTVFGDFADFVNSLPAADVVKVVRCRECKYSWCITGAWRCSVHLDTTETVADGFCHLGERRED